MANSKNNLKMKIVFMGTPEIGAQLFESLVSLGIDFSAVITNPDKPKGRGKEISMSPVKITAIKNNIPVFEPKNKSELTDSIKKLTPDLVIVGAFGTMIPNEALTIPKFGMINFHPSLLPEYRGPSPITTPIINNDPKTGVTIMFVSEGMDEGDIIDQKEIKLTSNETFSNLSAKLVELGAKMIAEIIPLLIKNEVKRTPQDDSRATYTKKVEKKDGQINWKDQTAEEIERMSRAYESWPGVYSFWNGKKINFYKISVSNKKVASGHISSDDKDIIIGTKDGSIKLNSLKIEGKNKITAEEFSRGYQNFIGSNLS